MANSVYDDKVPGEHELADNSNIPLGDPSDPRGHDTTPANKASDPRGDLQNAEQNSGMFNPHDDGGSSGGRLNPKALAAAEVGSAVAAGGVAGGIKKGLKQFMGSKKGRRSAIGGGATALIVTAIIALAGITSGPLQVIHLSKILERSFTSSNDSSEERMNGLFRYARSGSFGETRVSKLGSTVFGRTVDQLKDVGIEFQRNSLDRITSMSIDPKKLAKTYPDLDNMSPTEQKAFVSKTFDVPAGELSGSGSKFNVDTRNYGVKASRAILKNANGALENGDLIGGIKFRTMAKFFNEPSLFHPLSKISANQEKKLVNSVEARNTAETERQQAIEKTTLDEAAPAEKSLKEKLGSPRAVAGGALLLTAGLCLIRSSADDVVKVNQAAIVAPSVLKATDKLALGSQVQSGQGFSAAQLGSIVEAFKDGDGKTIFQSMPLQVLAGGGQVGEDAPYDYKQAFSNKTSAQSIKDSIGSPKVAGVDLGAAACSTPGIIIQGVIGIGLAVGSIIAAVPSGGASVAAETAKVSAGIAGTAGVVYLLEHQLTNLFADKALVPAVTSGPIGGTVLAYGIRGAEGIDGRSSGGIELSNTQATVLDKQQQAEDKKEFQSKSYFAKIFDANDYRSVTGRLADSVSPSMSQNVVSLVGNFTHLGSLIPHAFSALLPKTSAADKPYDWGFPIYGIPQDMLNDPNLENPYDNADKVAALLDGASGDSYVDKASHCFGTDISKGTDGWDVAFTKPVSPNDQDYIDAHCNDTSDSNWKRVMLFVFDTKTMDAAACYKGDDQSCQAIGIGSGVDNTSTPAATASSTFDIDDVFKDSSDLACPANTKDVGVHDGYAAGNKVDIRICALSNLPSTGEESHDAYGVNGADGKAVVNARVAGAFYDMVEAAKHDGITLAANSAYRSMAHQQSLCSGDADCAGGNYTYVAKPGTSNHQMGLAVDFTMPGTGNHTACVNVGGRCELPGDRTWQWLDAHAAQFGFKPYSAEFWHWSPTGN